MKALRLRRCASSSSPLACLPILPHWTRNHIRHLPHGLPVTLLPRQKPSKKQSGQSVHRLKDGLPSLSMKRGMSQEPQPSMKKAGKSPSALAQAGLCSNSGFLLVEGMLVVVITMLLVNAVSSAMMVFYDSDVHIEEATKQYDEQYRIALERGNGCDTDCRVTPTPSADPL